MAKLSHEGSKSLLFFVLLNGLVCAYFLATKNIPTIKNKAPKTRLNVISIVDYPSQPF